MSLLSWGLLCDWTFCLLQPSDPQWELVVLMLHFPILQSFKSQSVKPYCSFVSLLELLVHLKGLKWCCIFTRSSEPDMFCSAEGGAAYDPLLVSILPCVLWLCGKCTTSLRRSQQLFLFDNVWQCQVLVTAAHCLARLKRFKACELESCCRQEPVLVSGLRGMLFMCFLLVISWPCKGEIPINQALWTLPIILKHFWCKLRM